jgi:hypothetical protein
LFFTVGGTDAAYFWGGSAIVAVVCALLVAATVEDGQSVVDRLLSSSPAQSLGSVSYAFYLWHWPLILWLPYSDGAGFTERRIVDLSRFVITLVFSVASYSLFENAIRRGRVAWVGTNARRTLLAGLVASLGLLGVNHYLLSPSSSDSVAFSASDKSVEYCPDEPTPCSFHDAGTDRPLVVSMGDSTSQQYTPALSQLATQYDFNYVQAGIGGCPFDQRPLAKGPGSGDDRFLKQDLQCQEWADTIVDEVIALQPDVVLVADGQMIFRHEDVGGTFIQPESQQHIEDVLTGTNAVAGELNESGATVVLIEALPTLPDTDCLAANETSPESCDTDADLSSLQPYLDGWQMIAQDSDGGIRYISLLPEVCPGGETCPAILDGIVASYDGRHLTRSMSVRLAPRVGPRPPIRWRQPR